MAINRTEATALLREHMARTRKRSYSDLLGLRGSPENGAIVGPSGASYQIETQVFWDDRRVGTLRVLVSIDDGGLTAFIPMTEDFILSEDGSFVGE